MEKKRENFLSNNIGPTIDLMATTSFNASSLQGVFSGVAISGSGQYVATVASNAVYVSSSYGKSYSISSVPCSSYSDSNIAVAPSAPQYMMSGSTNGLYVSTSYDTTSSSASVTSAPSSAQWGAVAISGNGQYAYVAVANSGYSLYSSSNYLTSFAATNSPAFTGQYLSMAVSTDGTLVYAITGLYLYKHSTTGTTWTTLTPGSSGYSSVATSNNGQYVAVLDAYGENLYVFNYYGNSGTWTVSTSLIYGDFSCVSMSSSGQNIYIAAKGTSVYASTDYGATIYMTQAPPVEYQSIATTTSGTTVVAVSSEGSVYQTTNSGSTWTPNHYDWLDVAMSQDGQTTFALAGFSNYGFASMSTNNGATWLQTGYTTYYTAYTTVACDATCTFMVVSDDVGAYLYVTPNSGMYWDSIYVGSETVAYDYPMPALAVSSSGQYMSAGSYIYTSTNYGQTWKASTSTKQYWVGLAMSSSGQNQVAVVGPNTYSTGGYIYLSTNYGTTWSQASGTYMSSGWTSVASDSQGKNLIATASTSQSVYVSTNSGASWSSVTIVSAPWVSCTISSAGTYMYVVSSRLVYASITSGSTWYKLTSAPVWNYKAIASDSTGQYLTLVAFSGPVLKSSDYGTTWTTQNIVFSTTNDFGIFGWFWDDDIVETLATGAIVGIVIGSCAFCCCIALLIGFCFFGLCQKKSILQEEEKASQPVEIQMDKI